MRAAALVISTLLASPAGAGLVEIGFDDLAAGSSIQADRYAGQGVTINLIGLPGGSAQIWAQGVDNPVFRANGLDQNTLWPSPAPNRVAVDDGPFYDLEFLFTNPIDYFSIVADNAEEPYGIFAYSGATLLALTNARSFLGSNSGAVFLNEIGQLGGITTFDRVVIDLTEADGPESWDGLRFNKVTVVPAPATLVLFLSAVGALASWQRRSDLAVNG